MTAPVYNQQYQICPLTCYFHFPVWKLSSEADLTPVNLAEETTPPAGFRMRAIPPLLLFCLFLLLLPSIQMKKPGKGRGLKGARHKLTRDRYGLLLHLIWFLQPIFHRLISCLCFNRQGKRSSPSQQVRPIWSCVTQLFRVTRIWACLCRLPRTASLFYSHRKHMVQQTQAPPSSP